LERIPEASPSLRYVFGRVAPGHPREEATAQVAAIGARAATMFPETHENVRLQVLSLPDAVSDLPAAAALVLASINVFLVLLAALLCGNVAMLLFARAVSRERELLVRAALGASRGRLIMQLFAEAKNKVYKVTFQPLNTSNWFAPGHRLRIEVSSSNFPRFDRNLNTGGNN
jgi:hypothetical protein